MVSIIVDKDGLFDSDNYVFSSDDSFDYVMFPEWFDDSLVREMVLDVDKSTVVSPYCIESPILGQISPDTLSGGVKALIIMYKRPDLIVNATLCGDNCAKWILEIGKRQDITITLGYPMRFLEPMEIKFVDSGKVVRTSREYVQGFLEAE